MRPKYIAPFIILIVIILPESFETSFKYKIILQSLILLFFLNIQNIFHFDVMLIIMP